MSRPISSGFRRQLRLIFVVVLNATCTSTRFTRRRDLHARDLYARNLHVRVLHAKSILNRNNFIFNFFLQKYKFISFNFIRNTIAIFIIFSFNIKLTIFIRYKN